MAKGDQDQVKANIDSERARSNSMLGQVYDPMAAERQGAYDRGQAERESIRSGYQGFADTGGVNNDVITRLRGYATPGTTGNVAGSGGGGGSSSGGSTTKVSNAAYGLPEFEQRADYANFSKTGGYTDEDISNIRSRSTSAMPSLYATNRDAALRQSAVQGGGMPGYAASMAKMARATGQGLTDASRNAEVDIASQVRGGRLAGLAGMTDIDKAKLAAEMQQRQINAQRAAAGSAAGYQKAMLDLYNRQLGSQNERWIGEYEQGGKTTGLGGLLNLYKSGPGEQGMYDSNMMSLYGMSNQANQGLLNLEANQANQPGMFDKVMQGMGAAAGGMNAMKGMNIPGMGGGNNNNGGGSYDGSNGYYNGGNGGDYGMGSGSPNWNSFERDPNNSGIVDGQNWYEQDGFDGSWDGSVYGGDGYGDTSTW